MATSNSFSFGAWMNYCDSSINNTTGTTPAVQEAYKKDLKKAIAHAGYPSKDEIGVIDQINDFTMDNLAAEIPNMVSGFMKDTGRSFNIPAADDNTCAASIKVVAVDEKTKEGTIMFGDKKGESYTSTTSAHEELTVKNNRTPFKKD